MAEQAGGGSVMGYDPINYGLGTGWLDYYNQLADMLTKQGAAQGSTGVSTLDQLTKLLTSPTGGPLGLAATAAYGNPQGIAEKTGGKGIDTGQYTSNYDKLLNALIGYTSNINKGASDIPAVDPNKAPAMTPESAAQAKQVGQSWIDAWRAYHPGQPDPVPGYSLGGIVDRMLNGGVVPKLAGGGEATPTPTPDDTTPKPTVNPGAPQPVQFDPRLNFDNRNQPAADPYAAYGGKELVDAMNKYVQGGGDANKFVRTVQAIGRLNTLVQSGKLGVPGIPPVPGQPGPDLAHAGAGIITEMLRNYGQQAGLPDQLSEDEVSKMQGFADGGVTLAGQPHWIVTDTGKPVAEITEDGKAENVRGLKNGGVEVTPLTPDRYEGYTGREAGDPEWGRMLARMNIDAKGAPPLPGAATGQNFLFPQEPSVPNPVDTGAGQGSDMMVTFGGPSAAQDVGSAYGTGATPTSVEDLFKMAANAPGSSYNERYARLMGGAMSGNDATRDLQAQLNRGLAPTKLPTAQQLSTMTPSQRQGYTAMLQQMGIIQDPQDLAYFVKQYTPAGIG